MKYLTLALVAVLSAACNAMQDSPVAPSIVAPAGPATAPATRPQPTYAVSLSDNGGVAYLNQPWTTSLLVTSSDATVSPSSVSVQCGSELPQIFPGFLGTRIIACTFATRGDFPVTAAVVAPNAVTTSASVTLQVVPMPTPEQPQPITVLSIGSANRIGGTNTDQEWRLIANASENLSGFSWDFGNGTASSGNAGRTEQTIYHRKNLDIETFTVRISAKDPSGHEFTNQRAITISFK